MEKMGELIHEGASDAIKKNRNMFLRITLYLPLLAGPIAICAVIVFYNILCGKLCGTLCGAIPTDESARMQPLEKWIVFCELIAPWMLAATLAVYSIIPA